MSNTSNPTGREPALPQDDALTGREPSLGGDRRIVTPTDWRSQAAFRRVNFMLSVVRQESMLEILRCLERHDPIAIMHPSRNRNLLLQVEALLDSRMETNIYAHDVGYVIGGSFVGHILYFEGVLNHPALIIDAVRDLRDYSLDLEAIPPRQFGDFLSDL